MLFVAGALGLGAGGAGLLAGVGAMLRLGAGDALLLGSGAVLRLGVEGAALLLGAADGWPKLDGFRLVAAAGDALRFGSNRLVELRCGSYDGASRRGSLEGKLFRSGATGTAERGRTGSAERDGVLGRAGSSSHACALFTRLSGAGLDFWPRFPPSSRVGRLE